MGQNKNKNKNTKRIYDQGKGKVFKDTYSVNINPYQNHDITPYNPSGPIGPGGIGYIDPKKSGDCPYSECQGLTNELHFDCCYGQCHLDPDCTNSEYRPNCPSWGSDSTATSFKWIGSTGWYGSLVGCDESKGWVMTGQCVPWWLFVGLYSTGQSHCCPPTGNVTPGTGQGSGCGPHCGCDAEDNCCGEPTDFDNYTICNSGVQYDCTDIDGNTSCTTTKCDCGCYGNVCNRHCGYPYDCETIGYDCGDTREGISPSNNREECVSDGTPEAAFCMTCCAWKDNGPQYTCTCGGAENYDLELGYFNGCHVAAGDVCVGSGAGQYNLGADSICIESGPRVGEGYCMNPYCSMVYDEHMRGTECTMRHGGTIFAYGGGISCSDCQCTKEVLLGDAPTEDVCSTECVCTGGDCNDYTPIMSCGDQCFEPGATIDSSFGDWSSNTDAILMMGGQCVNNATGCDCPSVSVDSGLTCDDSLPAGDNGCQCECDSYPSCTYDAPIEYCTGNPTSSCICEYGCDLTTGAADCLSNPCPNGEGTDPVTCPPTCGTIDLWTDSEGVEHSNVDVLLDSGQCNYFLADEDINVKTHQCSWSETLCPCGCMDNSSCLVGDCDTGADCPGFCSGSERKVEGNCVSSGECGCDYAAAIDCPWGCFYGGADSCDPHPCDEMICCDGLAGSGGSTVDCFVGGDYDHPNYDVMEILYPGGNCAVSGNSASRSNCLGPTPENASQTTCMPSFCGVMQLNPTCKAVPIVSGTGATEFIAQFTYHIENNCAWGCDDVQPFCWDGEGACGTNEVLNCAPNMYPGWSKRCCPEGWVGDNYYDCQDQFYGCDLTCWDNDGGDCSGQAQCDLEFSNDSGVCNGCDYEYYQDGSCCCCTLMLKWPDFYPDCDTIENSMGLGWNCDGCPCC